MYCTQCGAEFATGSNFCPKCGKAAVPSPTGPTPAQGRLVGAPAVTSVAPGHGRLGSRPWVLGLVFMLVIGASAAYVVLVRSGQPARFGASSAASAAAAVNSLAPTSAGLQTTGARPDARPSSSPAVVNGQSPLATGGLAAGASTADEPAIKSLIERYNGQVQQAFARKDPSLVQGTLDEGASRTWMQGYRQQVATGVNGMKLLKMEWVEVGSDFAYTRETWQITSASGGYDETHETIYKIAHGSSGWRINEVASTCHSPGAQAGCTR